MKNIIFAILLLVFVGYPVFAQDAELKPSKFYQAIEWSRDGRYLSFTLMNVKNTKPMSMKADIYVMKADGTEMRKITGDESEEFFSSWSKDGKRVFFGAGAAGSKESHIFAVNTDGSGLAQITKNNQRNAAPVVSPDGKKIVFYTDRSGKYQIWTVDPDGNNLQQLTFSNKTAAMAPVFSPDASRLVFTEVDEKIQYSLFLDLTKSWEGQTPQNLPAIPENKSYSVRDWSKDGKKLLYIYFEPDGDETGTGVFDLEKQTFEKMTETGSSPFWLNDSRHFIFIDRNTLFLCDSATKKINELYQPSSYEIQQAVPSPDNRTIFFRYLQVDADVWLMESAPNQ